MISSKDIISLAKISRATLNNYIAMGLLPRPSVRAPDSGSDAPALGYFPDDTVNRIEHIQSLKRQGMSMRDIAEQLAPVSGTATAAPPAPTRTTERRGNPASQTGERRFCQMLSIDDLDQPAYMINYNFELTWFNEAARESILGFDTAPPDIESRNLFHLFEGMAEDALPRLKALYALHITLGKARLNKTVLSTLVRKAAPERVQMAIDCFDAAPVLSGRMLIEHACEIPDHQGMPQARKVYGVFFREGILVVHAPAHGVDNGLMELISRRDQLARNLLQKQLPVLTPLTVLLADLQGSSRICSELPPDEYFQLINEIWSAMNPIFRKHYGTYGKHVGDGMVYYFFPRPDSNHTFNALACAYEIRQEMRKISHQWQLRKNWHNELFLNIGLHEGCEWLGTFQSGANVEFAVLGDTINHAARLSEFARFGSIWATKALVSKLSADERKRVDFGVSRESPTGQQHFVAASYAQVDSLIDLSTGRYEKLREIANLPVTEIRSVEL